jgi:alpha 1,2-mannosyltransferase
VTWFDRPLPAPIYTPIVRRANATFMILARNSDKDGVASSIREIEEKFNSVAMYPYTFLNDEEFTQEFKEYVFS